MTSPSNKPYRLVAELSTLDEFLKEEGKQEEFEAAAIEEVVDWRIAEMANGRNHS
jgi:hypothetical protein